jgi:hypothetical protein
MDRIILIETSTALCSTALLEDGKIISYKENPNREHSALTAPFVKEMLDEHGLTVKDCNAVCVSMGPGSYTGLRVGVSTAKGLCFGAGLPLIAVNSLEVLAAQAIEEKLLPTDCKYIVPMIDARRMEVYTALFSAEGKQLTETEPKIIDATSFEKELSDGKVLFIGDGAEKCMETIKSPNACFSNAWPKASAMKNPALREYRAENFKDVAYFEPFYLKEFIATVSKKKLF